MMYPEENNYDATLMIFYNTKNRELLLSRRPGGEVLFPSEKGVHTPIENAKRGIFEEMGYVYPTKAVTLPMKISHDFRYEVDYVDKKGPGTASGVLITEWMGEINNIDKGKDFFFWKDINYVMSELSWDVSKFFFLVALNELYYQKLIGGKLLVDIYQTAPSLVTTHDQKG